MGNTATFLRIGKLTFGLVAQRLAVDDARRGTWGNNNTHCPLLAIATVLNDVRFRG
jgi:hypothetical protein